MTGLDKVRLLDLPATPLGSSYSNSLDFGSVSGLFQSATKHDDPLGGTSFRISRTEKTESKFNRSTETRSFFWGGYIIDIYGERAVSRGRPMFANVC